ncbi:MAG: putative toxin-antitoxin system toxin component, PIN family [Planctomycetia bacterium]
MIAFLRANSELVEPAAVPRGVLRDKDDLPILGTALAGAASCVVSGDKELLAIGSFAGIGIVSPRAFYDRLRG